MNVLILNGSPRKKGSTSAALSKKLKRQLIGCSVETCQIISAPEQEMLEKLKAADSVVFVQPLYVDGMPSHVIDFLKKAEAFCKENGCKPKVYAVSNNGFIEGKQNVVHLEQFRCWCERAGAEWAGGIGVGGGEMLRVISWIYPCLILVNFIASLFYLMKGAELNLQLFSQTLQNIGVYAFFCWHFWLTFGALSHNIRKNRKAKKNRFTRVFVPAFLFIIFADIFMVISSLLKGRFVFALLGKCKK